MSIIPEDNEHVSRKLPNFDGLNENQYLQRLSPLRHKTVKDNDGLFLTDRKINVVTFFFKKVSIFVTRLFLTVFSSHHHWDNDKRLVKHLNRHLSTYFDAKPTNMSDKEFSRRFSEGNVTATPVEINKVIESIEHIYSQLVLRKSHPRKNILKKNSYRSKLQATEQAIDALKRTARPGDGGRVAKPDNSQKSRIPMKLDIPLPAPTSRPSNLDRTPLAPLDTTRQLDSPPLLNSSVYIAPVIYMFEPASELQQAQILRQGNIVQQNAEHLVTATEGNITDPEIQQIQSTLESGNIVQQNAEHLVTATEGNITEPEIQQIQSTLESGNIVQQNALHLVTATEGNITDPEIQQIQSILESGNIVQQNALHLVTATEVNIIDPEVQQVQSTRLKLGNIVQQNAEVISDKGKGKQKETEKNDKQETNPTSSTISTTALSTPRVRPSKKALKEKWLSLKDYMLRKYKISNLNIYPGIKSYQQNNNLPFHLAASKSDVPLILNLLTAGGDIKQVNEEGRTAIYLLIKNIIPTKQKELITYLVSQAIQTKDISFLDCIDDAMDALNINRFELYGSKPRENILGVISNIKNKIPPKTRTLEQILYNKRSGLDDDFFLVPKESDISSKDFELVQKESDISLKDFVLVEKDSEENIPEVTQPLDPINFKSSYQTGALSELDSKVHTVVQNSDVGQQIAAVKVDLDATLINIENKLPQDTNALKWNTQQIQDFRKALIIIQRVKAARNVSESSMQAIREFEVKANEIFKTTLQNASSRANDLSHSFRNAFPSDKQPIFDETTGLTTLSLEQFKIARHMLKSQFSQLLDIAFTEEHRCYISELLRIMIVGSEVIRNDDQILRSSCCFCINELQQADRIVPYVTRDGISFINDFVEKFTNSDRDSQPSEEEFKTLIEEAIAQFGKDSVNRSWNVSWDNIHFTLGKEISESNPAFFSAVKDSYTDFLRNNQEQAKEILDARKKSLDNGFFKRIKDLFPTSNTDSLFSQELFSEVLKSIRNYIKNSSDKNESLITAISEATEINENLNVNNFSKNEVESLLRMKILEILIFTNQAHATIALNKLKSAMHSLNKNSSEPDENYSSMDDTLIVSTDFDRLTSFSKDNEQISADFYYSIDCTSLPQWEIAPTLGAQNRLKIAEVKTQVVIPSLDNSRADVTISPFEEIIFSWQVSDKILDSVVREVDSEISPRPISDPEILLEVIANELKENQQISRDGNNNILIGSSVQESSRSGVWTSMTNAASSMFKSNPKKSKPPQTLEVFLESLKKTQQTIYELRQKALTHPVNQNSVQYLAAIRDNISQLVIALSKEKYSILSAAQDWHDVGNGGRGEDITIEIDDKNIELIEVLQDFICEELLPLLPVKTGSNTLLRQASTQDEMGWKVHNYEQIIGQLKTKLEQIKQEYNLSNLAGASSNSLRTVFHSIERSLNIPISNKLDRYDQTYLSILREAYQQGFIKNLRQAALLGSQCKNPNEEELIYIKMINQLCESLYTEINLEPQALELIEKFNKIGEEENKSKSGHSVSSSSKGIVKRSEALNKNIKAVPNSFTVPAVYRWANSLRGHYVGLGFDPSTQGNPIMKLYDLDVSRKDGTIKSVKSLGMGTPTREGAFHYASINNEFKGFLRSYKDQGKRHLYINNQNLIPKNKVKGGDETDRCKTIMELQTDPELAGTFFGITLSKNSEFYKKGGENTDATKFQKDLIDQVFNLPSVQSGNFISPQVREEYKKKTGTDLLEWATILGKEIHSKIFNDGEDLKTSLTLGERKLFIEIFYDFLQEMIIVGLDVDSFNISCKDAIDRGAGSNAQLYARLTILNSGKDITPAQSKKFEALLEARALIVRKRPIMPERFERATESVAFMTSKATELAEIHNMFIGSGISVK